LRSVYLKDPRGKAKELVEEARGDGKLRRGFRKIQDVGGDRSNIPQAALSQTVGVTYGGT